jgi:hypothetical protein
MVESFFYEPVGDATFYEGIFFWAMKIYRCVILQQSSLSCKHGLKIVGRLAAIGGTQQLRALVGGKVD